MPKTGALKLQLVAYNRIKKSNRGEDFVVLPLYSHAHTLFISETKANYVEKTERTMATLESRKPCEAVFTSVLFILTA